MKSLSAPVIDVEKQEITSSNSISGTSEKEKDISQVDGSSVEKINKRRNTEVQTFEETLRELDILSGGPEAKTMKCPPPLVPFQNIIVTNISTTQMIPRYFHFSYKSRCLPQDIARIVDKWSAQFPNYSFFFHDDEGVENLISRNWNEFPLIHKAMRCVMYKGAMKIDVWRYLILYKYGGVYSDIDNSPFPLLDESFFPHNISAVFLQDGSLRPTQYFMSAEPYHPLMYLTLTRTITNILNLEDIRVPSLVKTTGPGVLRQAYLDFVSPLAIYMTEENFDAKKILLEADVPKIGLCEKYVMIKGNRKNLISPKPGWSDIVQYNATLNVTRAERIKMENGVAHWGDVVNPKISSWLRVCANYLTAVDKGQIKEYGQI